MDYKSIKDLSSEQISALLLSIYLALQKKKRKKEKENNKRKTTKKYDNFSLWLV